MWIEYQRSLIADAGRNRAFGRAIRAVVRPGMSVIDLGAGTGVLGFLALRAGAREALLIEQNAALSALSARLARANRLRGAVCLPAHHGEVAGLAPADVLLCETLGNHAYEENILEITRDVRGWLKPGGALLPDRIEQYACPVTSPRQWRELTAWERSGTGLDFAAARAMSLNNLYVRRFRRADLLAHGAAAACFDQADLLARNASLRRGEIRWQLGAPAVLHGLAVWWRAHLARGIWLSTSPLAPRTHWEQIFMPARTPLAARAGDVFSARITSDSRGGQGVWLRWELALSRAGRVLERQRLDMRQGGQ